MATTRDQENLKSNIRHVLELAAPDLLPDEVSQIVDEIDSSLAAYATQLRHSSDEPKDQLRRRLLEALDKSIEMSLAKVRDAANRANPTVRAEKRLRVHIKELLTKVDLNLTEDEQRKVEERMIRLLDEYAHARDEDKHIVYAIGVEAVLAALDPPAQSRGASARGSTA